MSERAVKPAMADKGIVDLSNDEAWQARLAEARERRAEALKKAGRSDAPKARRKKPWEDDDKAATPTPEDRIGGFDFHDRINRFKEVAGVATRSDTSTDELPAEPREGSNWFAGAEDIEDAPAEPQIQPEEAIAEPAPVRPMSKPVDSLFDAAEFYTEDPEPVVAPAPRKPDAEEESLLLAPEDGGFRRRTAAEWRQPQTQAPDEAPQVAASPVAAAYPVPPKKKRALGWLFIVAAALFGPTILVMQGAFWAPAGPGGPNFGLQPVLGTPAAFAEWPAKTVSGEWRPHAGGVPTGPAPSRDGLPPAFQRGVAALSVVEGGAVASGILAPVSVEAGRGGIETRTPALEAPWVERDPAATIFGTLRRPVQRPTARL